MILFISALVIALSCALLLSGAKIFGRFKAAVGALRFLNDHRLLSVFTDLVLKLCGGVALLLALGFYLSAANATIGNTGGYTWIGIWFLNDLRARGMAIVQTE